MIESITAKTGKSIKIFDKQTQSFKSTYEVLKELGSVWDKLSEADRALLGEKIAGKNQVNYASTLW